MKRIINWFKSMSNTETDEMGFPKLLLPMPEATTPGTYRRGDSTYTVLDISEPVFAIVECMKKYPSRFKVTYTDNSDTQTRTYKVEDVKTLQSVELRNGWSFRFREWSWKWLTSDEQEILEDTFNDINKIKHERLHSIQRAKMKGIYK